MKFLEGAFYGAAALNFFAVWLNNGIWSQSISYGLGCLAVGLLLGRINGV